MRQRNGDSYTTEQSRNCFITHFGKESGVASKVRVSFFFLTIAVKNM